MTSQQAAAKADLKRFPALPGRPVLVEDRERLRLYVTFSWPEPDGLRLRFTGWALRTNGEAYALDEMAPVLRDLPAGAVEIREPTAGVLLPLSQLAASYSGDRAGVRGVAA